MATGMQPDSIGKEIQTVCGQTMKSRDAAWLVLPGTLQIYYELVLN